jgi:hypothetical protein
MSKFLTNLDALGPQIILRIHSNERFKTVIGGIMTLISFMIISGLSIYFSVMIFGRKKPNVSFNTVVNEWPNFNISKTPILFGVFDSSGSPKPIDGVYNIKAEYKEMAEGKIGYEDTKYDLHLCTPDDDLGPYGDEYKDLVLYPFFWCLNYSDPEINQKVMYGKAGTTTANAFWGFFINRCVDYTSSSNCFNDDYTGSYLIDTYVMLLYIDHEIDSNNFETPGKPFLTSQLFSISSTIYKSYAIPIINVEYMTDIGFLFENQKQDNYTTIGDNIITSTDLRRGSVFDGNFSTFIFSGYQTKRTFFRSYPKIQDLLANIGGVLKGVMIFFSTIQNFIVRKLLLRDIYHNIFDTTTDDRKISQKFPEKEKDLSNFEKKIEKDFTGALYKNEVSSLSSRGILRKISWQINNNIKCDKHNGTSKEYNAVNEVVSNRPYFDKEKIVNKLKRMQESKKLVMNLKFSEFFAIGKFKKTGNIEILNMVEKYIHTTSSIDYIFQRFNELDKIKFIIFSKEELDMLKYVNNPKIHDCETNIQILWKKYGITNYVRPDESKPEDFISYLKELTINERTQKMLTLF